MAAAGCKDNFISNYQTTPGGDHPIVPESRQLKILLIGSSYLGYNDFPSMFANFCTGGSKLAVVETAIEYGKLLDYHSENPATIEKIHSQKWDYVVLQDAPSTIGYPDNHNLIFPSYTKHDIYKAIAKLDSIIRSNNNLAKTILVMPWAYEDGLTWIQGQTDTYEIMQKNVFDNSVAWAKELNIGLSPVGWAFNEVLKTNKQLHYLFQSDFNHPSYKGAYLMACVLYTTIYNESCRNNSYFRYLNKSEAEYFQNIASELRVTFNYGL